MYQCSILSSMVETKTTVKYYKRKGKKGGQLSIKYNLDSVLGFENGEELFAVWDDESKTLTIKKM